VARKSALDRIDNHEKICRLMQKQTFDQIKEIKDRILRLEKMILAAGGAIILALIANIM
jgi:dihydrodipicolinate synthase/N-acetylneuraminate lyase